MTDTHATPSPGLAGAIRVRDVIAIYRAMVPWLLLTWTAAVFIPGPDGQQILLIAGASPFLVAAAARGLGLHPGWTVAALAVDRAFTHLTNILLLLLLAAFAAAVGGTLGAMIADLTGLPDDRILSMPAAALAALPVLWWHWPAAVVAYLVPEDAGYRRPGGRAWRGPRYGDARRLHGVAGSAVRTAGLLALIFLWIAVLAAAGSMTASPAASHMARAATYLFALPLLTALAAIETLRMIVEAEAGAAPSRDRPAPPTATRNASRQ